MLTKDHAQEGLSRAYVQAVAAAARANLRMGHEFDYGFDGTFDSIASRIGMDSKGEPVHRYVNAGFPIDFQLKCTWTWTSDDADIIWSIKTKAYNDLVTRPPEAVAVILILMCLPTDEREWVNISEDAILLRKCCYFTTLTGTPTVTETSTKQIRISRRSVLDAANLSSALVAERRRRMELF
ncbi:DUF4365 domain-containing protein [Mesorhizobium sp. M7A.F.Ca.US.006.01.1.1]|nr:DUF4365 domain-containing protein [Mesorhizobium sp. M7A.F.Ca.US.006.01.1.1]